MTIQHVLTWAATLLMMVGWGGPALAQDDEPSRIAIVRSRNSIGYAETAKGFLMALRQQQDLKVEVELYTLPADNDEAMGMLGRMEEFVPDLIVAVGPPATQRAQEFFFDIPIVFTDVLNPVDLGLVVSFERTDTNLTGFVAMADPALQAEVLKQLAGELKTVGLLYNPRHTGQIVIQLRKAFAAVGAQLMDRAVDSPASASAELDRLKGQIDAMWLLAESSVYTARAVTQAILDGLEHQIPIAGHPETVVRAGATVGFFPDSQRVGAEAWTLSARILRGEMAMEEFQLYYPARASTVISYNPVAAEQIGVEIPEEILTQGRPVYVPAAGP